MDVGTAVQRENYKQLKFIGPEPGLDSPSIVMDSLSSHSSTSGYQSEPALPDEIAELAITGIQGQANITLSRCESMPTGFGAGTDHLDQPELHFQSLSALDVTTFSQFDYEPTSSSMKCEPGVIITNCGKCASMPTIPIESKLEQYILPAHIPSSPRLSLSYYDVIIDQSDCSPQKVFEQHHMEPEVLVEPTLPVLPSSSQAESIQHADVCQVCLMEAKSVQMPCCALGLCTSCLYAVVEAKLDAGVTTIVCPGTSCQGKFEDAHIRGCLAQNEDLLAKYTRFRVAHSEDPTEKLCPFCSHVTVHRLPEGRPVKKFKESDVAVTCESCGGKWCFSCHAPWHSGTKCSDFRKGDKLFTKWLKQRQGVQANAQRCPKCAIPIQRTTGCDTMQCTKCHARFCYRCGGFFRSNVVFGSHSKYLTINGCKGRYMGSAAEREAARYGYLFAKCTFLAAYPVVFIGAVAVVSVGALVFLCYKGVRKLRKK